MSDKRKEYHQEKAKLHPRSKHRNRYDFKKLIESYEPLKKFVARNRYGDDSVDFFDPEAVKALNRALLKFHYDIDGWEIPDGYLCPPIPGRADYIHHIADLLANSNRLKVPRGRNVKCLDIGVGSNCIYPIIGAKEYRWSFTGTDIDPVSIESANSIIKANGSLAEQIEIELQSDSDRIFDGIIKKGQLFDIVICNPPFHASEEEARESTMRKLRNLTRSDNPKEVLNFSGQNSELWCEGGEIRFVRDMIYQSKEYSRSCFWFTSLISKRENLKKARKSLKNVGATDFKIIEMGQGNKISRILAWTFLSPKHQSNWAKERWSR